ncbi:TadE/TadG family type IV pilus assembly protein [Promicromonospora soli]
MIHIRSQENGSVAIETTIVVPVLGLVILLILFGGRVMVAQQSIQTAAAAAARAASLARVPSLAHDDARTAAGVSLANQQVRCAATDVVVDTAGLTAPVGTTSAVSATVTCHVDLTDLGVPFFPGTRAVSASMTSGVDVHRERP